MRRSEVGPGLRVLAGAIVTIARALFRIRVDGIEHVPADAGAVVVANHVSALDGAVLAAVLWWKRRRVGRFVVAAEFFDARVFGSVLRAFHQVPVHRGARDTRAIALAVEAAVSGGVVGVFPEGRVNPDPVGTLQPGRTGAARIALASRAPVVPAAIWGTQGRWPRDGLLRTRPFRMVVAVSFGAPVALEGEGSYDDARSATDAIMAAVETQVDAARALAER